MGAERRVFPRANLHVRSLLIGQGINPIEGRTKDISIGGLCIMAPQTAADGTEVLIRIEIPMKGKFYKMELRSKVVNSVLTADGYRIGLQFVQLEDQNSQIIQNFVRFAGVRPPGL